MVIKQQRESSTFYHPWAVQPSQTCTNKCKPRLGRQIVRAHTLRHGSHFPNYCSVTAWQRTAVGQLGRSTGSKRSRWEYLGRKNLVTQVGIWAKTLAVISLTLPLRIPVMVRIFLGAKQLWTMWHTIRQPIDYTNMKELCSSTIVGVCSRGTLVLRVCSVTLQWDEILLKYSREHS